MTEQEKAASPEFLYLPLGSIIVEEQICSGIDTEGELRAVIRDPCPVFTFHSFS